MSDEYFTDERGQNWSSDDFFLRDTIADSIAKSFQEVPPDEDFQYVFADRVLAALADRGSEWVVKKKDQWLEAATAIGDASACIPGGCWHFYHYDNATLARDKNPDPNETSYLHICGLDSQIAELIALRELHRRYRAGEDLPLCEHPITDGGGCCQACGVETGKRSGWPDDTP